MNLHEAFPPEKFDEDYIDDIIDSLRESGMNPRIRKYTILAFCKEIGVKVTEKMILKSTDGVKI